MYYLAFILGLTSSLHCVGMCGPIALALPVHKRSGVGKVLGVSLYNLGRVGVYAGLGFLVGGVGFVAHMGNWQQWLSVGAGVLLLIGAVGSYQWWQGIAVPGFLKKWVLLIQQNIQSRLSKQGFASLTVMGMFNGLLPCGMVYLALVSAVATTDSGSSALYMAAFGAGTFPAMLTTALLGQWASVSWRVAFKKMTPYLIGLAGIVLIVRGLSSPSDHHHHQASKPIPVCVGE